MKTRELDAVSSFALIFFVALVLACAFGMRFVRAKYVYDDWRCAFAQCRIEVRDE